MRIFNFRQGSGEYVGEGVADPNPLEEGQWIIPAFATTEEPPEVAEGFAAIYAGGWQVLSDHRGETWWKADAKDNTAGVEVDFIGDPAERGLTSIEPPPPPAAPAPPLTVTPRQIRQALNIMGLRAPVEAWVMQQTQDVIDNWQFAQEFVRSNSMIEEAAEALGHSDEEIDELFAIAKAL